IILYVCGEGMLETKWFYSIEKSDDKRHAPKGKYIINSSSRIRPLPTTKNYQLVILLASRSALE
ncbi:28599_t:CDS:1, partial [Racocetra persica]